MRMTHPLAIVALVLTTMFAGAAALAADTLHEGAWTKKTQKASGTWSIVEEDGARFVVLSDEFKTKKAPDLKLFVSPKTVKELKNKNATEGSAFIAQLTSHKGGQRYEIPSSIELDDYTSIIIHCEKYTKLWCAAEL